MAIFAGVAITLSAALLAASGRQTVAFPAAQQNSLLSFTKAQGGIVKTIYGITCSLLLCGVYASPAEAIQNVTELRNAIVHPTNGCGGAVVMTPAPGTQFANPVANVPQGVTPFFELAARRNVTWLSEMHCAKSALNHALVPAPTAGGSSSGVQNSVSQGVSGNWSGYLQPHTAQYIQAGWTVPSVIKPPTGAYSGSPSKYYSSAWAGIGGSSSSQLPLIQSGTEHDITPGGVVSYSFWYQVYGGTTDTGSSITVTNLAISQGNSVGNVALWDINSTNAQMGVCNFSLNTCLTFTVPNTPAPGNSVEWIGEAPSIGVIPQPLADFGSIGFNNACWVQNYVVGGSNTCSAIGSSPTFVQLQQYVFGSYQIIASPGSITQDTVSSAFSDIYIPPERVN